MPSHHTRSTSRPTERQPPVPTIGLQLHKRETQLCILAPDGTAREPRIVTTRERFTAVLRPLAPATVLLEASTESVPAPARYRQGATAMCR
jgi:hypothetical protein